MNEPVGESGRVFSVEQNENVESAATEEYAIVEVFGHRRHAGRVCEVEKFGTKLLRIDIPTDGDFAKGFTTHFYGGSSIFSFSPCDLAMVQKVNKPYDAAGRLTYREPEPDEIDDGEPLF
jgi:hypothetical protein